MRGKHLINRGSKAGPIRRVRDRRPVDDDSLLVKQVKAGDQQAFETLYRRYVSTVYRQALKLAGNAEEAEEIVQEVFLRLYEKAKTFRGDSAFSTWLYRLTVNTALMKLRRRKRAKEIALDDYLPRYQEDGHHLVRPVIDWSQDPEGRLDSAENILANKVTALIDREEPKDLADIWGFCCRMGISLREAIQGAESKAAGIFPADLARVLCSAGHADWELVRWTEPPSVEQFLADLRVLGESLVL